MPTAGPRPAASVACVIRTATPDDVPDIVRLIRALADYQDHLDEARASENDLRAALFPATAEPRVFAHVAQVDGRVVGMAIWFPTFSTWTGRHGIWLEDLFVEAEHRGSGVGIGLLGALARECRAAGYPRLEWHVARWNEPSIAFYDALGAVDLDDQQTFRLSGEALTAMAGRA